MCGLTSWCHSGPSGWFPRDGLRLSSLALQPILFILFRKSFNQSHRPLCRFQSPWYLMLLTTLFWQFLFLALFPFYLPVSSPATYNSPSLGVACRIPLQSLWRWGGLYLSPRCPCGSSFPSYLFALSKWSSLPPWLLLSLHTGDSHFLENLVPSYHSMSNCFLSICLWICQRSFKFSMSTTDLIIYSY